MTSDRSRCGQLRDERVRSPRRPPGRSTRGGRPASRCRTSGGRVRTRRSPPRPPDGSPPGSTRVRRPCPARTAWRPRSAGPPLDEAGRATWTSQPSGTAVSRDGPGPASGRDADPRRSGTSRRWSGKTATMSKLRPRRASTSRPSETSPRRSQSGSGSWWMRWRIPRSRGCGRASSAASAARASASGTHPTTAPTNGWRSATASIESVSSNVATVCTSTVASIPAGPSSGSQVGRCVCPVDGAVGRRGPRVPTALDVPEMLVGIDADRTGHARNRSVTAEPG